MDRNALKELMQARERRKKAKSAPGAGAGEGEGEGAGAVSGAVTNTSNAGKRRRVETKTRMPATSANTAIDAPASTAGPADQWYQSLGHAPSKQSRAHPEMILLHCNFLFADVDVAPCVVLTLFVNASDKPDACRSCAVCTMDNPASTPACGACDTPKVDAVSKDTLTVVSFNIAECQPSSLAPQGFDAAAAIAAAVRLVSAASVTLSPLQCV